MGVAYCLKCHASRAQNQIGHLSVKPCPVPDAEPIAIGEEVISFNHVAVLQFSKWQRQGKRPAYRCLTCNLEVWASKGYKTLCMGTA